jgi:hypothetical protein
MTPNPFTDAAENGKITDAQTSGSLKRDKPETSSLTEAEMLQQEISTCIPEPVLICHLNILTSKASDSAYDSPTKLATPARAHGVQDVRQISWPL